jgi:hypothetical protein
MSPTSLPGSEEHWRTGEIILYRFEPMKFRLADLAFYKFERAFTGRERSRLGLTAFGFWPEVVPKSGCGKFAAVKCRASPKFLHAGFSGASRTTSTVWRLLVQVV